MSETTVPVAEAAVIVRNGKRVATLSPLLTPVLTCAELADRWPNLERLAPDEASAFADDIEQACRNIPPVRPAWD